MPGLIAKIDMQEPDRDEILVYTGAVFEGVNRALGRGRVGVPSHGFKIVWDSELEEIFTWLIPNDDFDFVDIADFVPWR